MICFIGAEAVLLGHFLTRHRVNAFKPVADHPQVGTTRIGKYKKLLPPNDDLDIKEYAK